MDLLDTGLEHASPFLPGELLLYPGGKLGGMLAATFQLTAHTAIKALRSAALDPGRQYNFRVDSAIKRLAPV